MMKILPLAEKMTRDQKLKEEYKEEKDMLAPSIFGENLFDDWFDFQVSEVLAEQKISFTETAAED